MPVFVEWKWQEKTKSFLVVFHFHDDFSRPNLRIKKYDVGHFVVQHQGTLLHADKAWMTWAPSHPDLALLAELLLQANIINGFNEIKKRTMIPLLEGFQQGAYIPETDIYDPDIRKADISGIREAIGADKKIVCYIDARTEGLPSRVIIELCPEYIEYLKKLLKPYLK